MIKIVAVYLFHVYCYLYAAACAVTVKSVCRLQVQFIIPVVIRMRLGLGEVSRELLDMPHCSTCMVALKVSNSLGIHLRDATNKGLK